MGTAGIEEKTLFSREATASTEVDVSVTTFFLLPACFIAVMYVASR